MKLSTRTILGALLAIGIGGCVNDASNPVIGDGPADGSDAAPGAADPMIPPPGMLDSGSPADGATGPAADSDGGVSSDASASSDAAVDAGADADAAPDAPPPIPGKTLVLTGGADLLTGEGGDDTFTSTTNGGFGAGDVLDGAGGTDILSVFSIANVAPTGVTVSNIETAALTSLGSVTVDSTAWSGLANLLTQAAGDSSITAGATTDVNVTSVGSGSVALNGGHDVTVIASNATSGSISVGSLVQAAGAISVSRTSTSAGTMGAINVKGGTAVSVQQVASNAVGTNAFMGTVTVTGTAATTSVSVAGTPPSTASGQTAGVIDGSVWIRDANSDSTTLPGTITSVAASSYTTLSIDDSALRSLSVRGGSGNMFINNGNLIAPTNTTLGVTLDGLTGGSLIDAGVYTTLNLTTAGTPSRIANISQSAVTALTVGGTSSLTLMSTAGLPALGTVVVKDAAGLTADLSSYTLTSVTNTGSGDVTATIDGSRATFTGGSGVDRVSTLQPTVSKAIDLGAGDDFLTLNAYGLPTANITGGPGFDTLRMDSTNAATVCRSTAFKQVVTGFEALELTGTTNQTVDLANMGAITRVTTWGGNGFTMQNMPSDGTFALTGPGTAYTASNPAFAAGGSDVINLVLKDGSEYGVNFATTGISLPDVETVHITTIDAQATPAGDFTDTVTLLGNTAKTITVAGNAGMRLTASDHELTMLDASGITLGDFGFNAGQLTAPATIKGSATGTNTVDASWAMAITYVGGSGNDILTLGGNHGNHVIALGDGANDVSVGNGSNIITSGSGNDYIQIGASTGPSTIDVGSGTDWLALAGIPQSASAFATVTGMGAGDHIDITATLGTAVTFSAQTIMGSMMTGSATLADYLDACTAGDAHSVSVIKWFQLDGKTYIVHDTSAAGTFQAGQDTVIALTGLIDLSTATIGGRTINL